MLPAYVQVILLARKLRLQTARNTHFQTVFFLLIDLYEVSEMGEPLCGHLRHAVVAVRTEAPPTYRSGHLVARVSQ